MSEGNRSCDVLVVGGGISGAVAAVASARSGSRTVLIEKENVLGGVGFSGMLQHICGLYLNGDDVPKDTLNQGITSEIVTALSKLSPKKRIVRMGKVYVLSYSRFNLQYALNSLCLGESNLSVALNTTAVSVAKEQESIHEVSLYNCGEQYSVLPKIVIDCSGDGDVSIMAGAAYELSSPDNIQLAGYTIKLKNVHDQDESLAVKVPYCLGEAVNNDILPGSTKFSNYSPGDAPDEGYCKLSFEVADDDQGKLKTQEHVLRAHRYLAERLPSFKDSYIAETSTGVINREGRRICGEYTLTEEDVLAGRKFPDGVVRNSWPIELWDKNKGTIYKYVKSGDYYEIPFRCLKVRGLPNLLCAGRIISVSHEAHASTRVMGTCMALGEQAGKAAAYYVESGNYPEFDKN